MSAITIVVADDHPIVRAGMVALLSAVDDITVVGEAKNGLEALELARTTHPDLVLMDLRMPELGGAEATARILKESPTVKVLVLTTYESDDHILSAIEAGASGYLLKASPEAEIIAGVRAVLSGETVLAPSVATRLVERMRNDRIAATVAKLSARELEVLKLVATGKSNPQIARELFIGEATVKSHVQHIFEKLSVDSRTRAVTRAMELGLL